MTETKTAAEPKRFNMCLRNSNPYDWVSEMREEDEGEYVKHSDVAPLLKRIEELESERQNAVDLLEQLLEGMGDHTCTCETGVGADLSKKMREVQVWLIQNPVSVERCKS